MSLRCVEGHNLVDVVLAKLAGGFLVNHTAPSNSNVWLTTDVSAEGAAGSVGSRKVL